MATQRSSLNQAVQASLQYQQSLEDSISNQTMDDQNVRDLTRRYISTQLRRHDFEEMASRITVVDTEAENPTLDILLSLSEQVENEFGQEMEGIFDLLLLSADDLKPTYEAVASNVFSDNINWGRVLVFLVFSSKLALYCMKNGMEDRVLHVVGWTEGVMQHRLQSWVHERGGWTAFVSHFDTESWKISLPKFATFSLLAALAAFGGFVMLKKLWR